MYAMRRLIVTLFVEMVVNANYSTGETAAKKDATNKHTNLGLWCTLLKQRSKGKIKQWAAVISTSRYTRCENSSTAFSKLADTLPNDLTVY